MFVALVSRVVFAVGAGLILLLAWLMAARSFEPHDPDYDFDRVTIGMTEAEVEAIYGSAVIVSEVSLKPDEARTRRVPNVPDDRPTIITVKGWYYDEHHSFEVEFDEHLRQGYYPSRVMILR